MRYSVLRYTPIWQHLTWSKVRRERTCGAKMRGEIEKLLWEPWWKPSYTNPHVHKDCALSTEGYQKGAHCTQPVSRCDVSFTAKKKISFLRPRSVIGGSDLGVTLYRCLNRDIRIIGKAIRELSFLSRHGYEVTRNRTTGAWKWEVTGITIFLFCAYAGEKNNEASVA